MSHRAGIIVELAPGELIDRITILEIRSERISDRDKLRNVSARLATLVASRDRAIPATPELIELTRQLRQANEILWQSEDRIRDCERRQDFGPGFIELARAVYKTNDRRSAIKRRIDELLGSPLLEYKTYAPY